MPRRAMSSVKEVSRRQRLLDALQRGATKVPEPWRWTRMPSRTRSCTALRTVTRDTSALTAMSRSEGSASPGPMTPRRTASSIERLSFR